MHLGNKNKYTVVHCSFSSAQTLLLNQTVTLRASYFNLITVVILSNHESRYESET